MSTPQAQVSEKTLPVIILEKVIRLARYFYQQLDITLPMARATGMIYFNNFYQNRKYDKPEYAKYAVAALYLATKMCECPRSLTNFVKIVYETITDPSQAHLFSGLDGISPPSNEEDYVGDLYKNLIKAEMDIITHFHFNFEVKLPYTYCEHYISKILLWHLEPDSEFYQPLKSELRSYSWIFLNDLLFTPEFYINDPELVALVSVKLSFDRIQLPLISPVSQKWHNALAPEYSAEKFSELFDVVNTFFVEKTLAANNQIVVRRKTPISDEEMTNWIRYPFDEKSLVPMCPPPSSKKLKEFIGGNPYFTKLDASHLPNYEPRSNKELHSFMDEVNLIKEKFKDEYANDEWFAPKKKNKKKKKKIKINQKPDDMMIDPREQSPPRDYRDRYYDDRPPYPRDRRPPPYYDDRPPLYRDIPYRDPRDRDYPPDLRPPPYYYDRYYDDPYYRGRPPPPPPPPPAYRDRMPPMYRDYPPRDPYYDLPPPPPRYPDSRDRWGDPMYRPY